jgi:phosphatidylserine/phosphatidylglycerophosphate/cardiolipin synthase-like enzyme
LTARYYTSSRDFLVFDRDPADVAAIDATFDNDWTNGGLPPASPADLVWSPGAQDALVALIASARHTLLVENEEMNDSVVVHALQTAARRGVDVEVVMTRQSDWASAFSALAQSGVAVRTYSASAPLYIHAKAIVVDPGSPRARVFLGSQNFSVASLLYDRELGVVSPRPALVATVAAIIRRDGAGATVWQP